jgi:hypothetical protein
VQALGASLGVPLDCNKACSIPADWQPIQLLQRCGPQLSAAASENLANDSRSAANGAQTGALLPPVIGQGPMRISNTTQKPLEVGISSNVDHSSGHQVRLCRSGAQVSDMRSVTLDPVRLHCQTLFPCSGSVSMPAPLACLGASVGPEWRMVRMVRERVPVDLLPHVPLEGEHEAVCPIFDSLLELVASRLQVHTAKCNCFVIGMFYLRDVRTVRA